MKLRGQKFTRGRILDPKKVRAIVIRSGVCDAGWRYDPFASQAFLVSLITHFLNDVYQIGCGVFEVILEGEMRVTMNGHHVAQKLSETFNDCSVEDLCMELLP